LSHFYSRPYVADRTVALMAATH